MSRFKKSLFLGLLIALIGVAASFFDTIHELEEDVGLGLLFRLRGATPPPAEVVIVSIDRESSERLGLPDNPDRWPRSLHAQLIDTLAKRGASVIVFDLYFIDPRSRTEDDTLAEAMRNARTVILAEPLKAKDVPPSKVANFYTAEHRIVETVKPIAAISQAAFASAPFVLPKLPVKVNQYWAFQTAAGGSPTFPVVAFQLYAMSAYDDFLRFLKAAEPVAPAGVPQTSGTLRSGGVLRVIRDIRAMFEGHPLLAGRVSAELQRSGLAQSDRPKALLVQSLVELYAGADHRYLNYYGPPRTLRTVPFHQLLQTGKASVDLRGKAIFVGLSEIALTERKDSFYTTFSRPNGIFLSGVEIAATAFANLLHNTAVIPVSPLQVLAVVSLWGLLIGAIGGLTGPLAAPLVIAAAGLMYSFGAVFKFQSDGTWYPVLTPLFIQSPMAMIGAVLWNYFETNRQRQNIRKALSYYVPDEVVDHLAANIADIRRDDHTLYGVCLFTDCEGYTSLSETIPAQELSDVMHRYFGVVFRPIKQNGGRVMKLEGDGMLAVWHGAQDDPEIRNRACMAALEIAGAVHGFNESLEKFRLPTRIAVHAGEIFFGNVGTEDQYKYGVMGDTVNTTSRMDGLNKHLGTEVLVSSEVIRNDRGFLAREAGTFVFKGKRQRIRVYELLCRADEAADTQRHACAIFAEGLAAFRGRSWRCAEEKFKESAELSKGDPLAGFYLKLLKEYEKRPVDELWEGVVELEEK